MVTSAEGIVIRFPATDISVQGRNTQGVRIMNLKSGDKVVGMARIKTAEDPDQLKLTDLTSGKAEEELEVESEEEEVEEIGELEEGEEVSEEEKEEVQDEEEY